MNVRRQHHLLPLIVAIVLILSAISPAISISAAGDVIGPENAKKLKEIALLEADAGGVYSLAVSADGKLIASGHEDGSVHVWDAATHKELSTLKGEDEETNVSYLKFTPDGKLFSMSFFTMLGQMIRFWDIKSGKAIPYGSEKFGMMLARTAVGLSDDGKTIALGDCGSEIAFGDKGSSCIKTGMQFQEVKTEKLISSFEPSIQGSLWAIVFSPDGKLAVLTGEDGTIRLVDVKTSKFTKTLAKVGKLTLGAAFSKDGTLVAVSGVDGTARVWNVKTGAIALSLKANATAAVVVAFSPDGKLLAVAGEDAALRLWDVKTKKQVVALKNHTGIITGLTFSPDGTTLISAALDGKVRVWGFE